MTNIDEVKNKLWMKKAQADAKKIMVVDNSIWQKHGWRSGGQVKKAVLKAELKTKLKGKKFDPVVAEILEDANFHSTNDLLQEMKILKYKGNRLSKYTKLGGKTWEL